MSRLLQVLSIGLASVFIMLGGLIYFCYRPLSLAMFKWLRITNTTTWLASLRSSAPAHMPEWVIYAFPDGLWACSYAIFIGVIWNFEYPKCIPVALFIPLIGVVSEFLQAFRLLPGIFDWWDLIMYIVGGIVGYAYIYWANRINSYNYKSLNI